MEPPLLEIYCATCGCPREPHVHPCPDCGDLKGVEDAVCYLLGADDGNPQWHPIPAQECGGLVGVKVVLEVMS